MLPLLDIRPVEVLIKGKLNGTPVRYTIPFRNDHSLVKVLRNHLYVINLGDSGTPIEPGSEVKFSISVNDWNEQLLNENFDLFTLEYNGEYGTLTKEPGKYVLRMHDNRGFDLDYIYIRTKFAPLSIVFDAIEEVNWFLQPASSVGDGEGINHVQVFLYENTTGVERRGRIFIIAIYEGQTSYIPLEVIQPA